MALHSRGSIMSLNELSEEELDSRIKAGFQRVMQNLARCTALTYMISKAAQERYQKLQLELLGCPSDPIPEVVPGHAAY